MANFTKVRLLERSIRIKLCKYFSTKQYPFPHLKEQNKINESKTNFQHKIIYSSVLEDKKLHLRYQKNKIYLDKLNKEARKERLEKIKIKPLPVSLKLVEGANIDIINDEISSKQNNKEEIKENSNEINSKKLFENWMHDYEFYDENNEQKSIMGTPGINV